MSSGNRYDGSQCPEKCSEDDREMVQTLLLSISEHHTDEAPYKDSKEVGTARRCRDLDYLYAVNE